MAQIANLFNTTTETISDFFRRPGIGYYIPLYQREYSWDRENIDQLMEDVFRGVEALLTQDDTTHKDNAIHFMGTIILVTERYRHAIQPQDNRALPTRVDNVIDGQQRLSTIAMLSCLLYDRIQNFIKTIPHESPYDGLHEAAKGYLKLLIEVFSVNLDRGTPERKPIIIRGSIDTWTLDGSDKDYYLSDVSFFLASAIRAAENETALDPDLNRKKSMVMANIRQMNMWLKRVETAHEFETIDASDEDRDEEIRFPTAQEILATISADDLWSYERPELKASIIRGFEEKMNLVQKDSCSLVQLFAFCHYLLRCCCFTSIEPTLEDRAFDMFQSLNATGTPLTALETFKPMVVSIANTQDNGFKGSHLEKIFESIDILFGSVQNASAKNKLTNEYLTTFAVAQDGHKLARQFSAQRRWLNREYTACKTYDQREEFIRRMSELAVYWNKVIKFDPKQASALSGTESVPLEDQYLAALCIMYLEDSGHKMAHSILSRFYALVLRQVPGSAALFVQACKTVTAFYTLWRSALPNTGLDNVYRKLLAEYMSWKKCGTTLDIAQLKQHLRDALNESKRAIGSKDLWKQKALQYLRYDNNKHLCQFALLVTAHDTIPDPDQPGLMKIGSPGYCPYLLSDYWKSNDLKSIEHVAPQTAKTNGNWDQQIYDEEHDQLIGNLTLLPIEINISAGNQGWIAKWIYYRHLAEADPAKLEALADEAKTHSVELASTTIKALREAKYAHHITPLVQLGASGCWDKALIAKRTERICDILWDRLYAWLE
ncbi:MAG: DUF262 domain-containing protein [Chloroflexaceae bacterium]|nr:DUF262 domain-containing protein [Chloroflexaceae bacterium]